MTCLLIVVLLESRRHTYDLTKLSYYPYHGDVLVLLFTSCKWMSWSHQAACIRDSISISQCELIAYIYCTWIYSWLAISVCPCVHNPVTFTFTGFSRLHYPQWLTEVLCSLHQNHSILISEQIAQDLKPCQGEGHTRLCSRKNVHVEVYFQSLVKRSPFEDRQWIRCSDSQGNFIPSLDASTEKSW